MTDVEDTASGAGMMRALERYASPPLFDDPLAERFLTGWPAVVTRHRLLRQGFLRTLDRAGPGFYGAVVCRTRAIDDACREALADGLSQVVVLGAGMDTRPYRMPMPDVWELDLPRVQDTKKAAVVRALGALPEHVRYAPIDLAREPVPVVPGQPALVLCEAVSMYLSSLEHVLAYAAALPPGSRFIFTYLPHSVFDDPRYAGWRRRLRWRTAFEPSSLTRLGFSILDDLGGSDYQSRYLRPAGRVLDVFPGERVVIAARRSPR
ncbi:class I SAM-dependent methyltransferase [Actinoplanes sp. RD1]|uniref:class I SAM-dependent methyltransferase n=1 Tax=Actinoplanes sp. RD1 TaxID=3064538 RepID=UPI002740B299|nr:SAM-dependent methyltransferase [Actinoplanes sp. RD1]